MNRRGFFGRLAGAVTAAVVVKPELAPVVERELMFDGLWIQCQFCGARCHLNPRTHCYCCTQHGDVVTMTWLEDHPRKRAFYSRPLDSDGA
jgi:hypothetical protein